MRFRAGTYGLNFCHDLLKHILEVEKLKSFVRILLFFQSMPKNKSYTPISSKQRKGGNKKTLQNFELYFLNFFSHMSYFFLFEDLWFIPFGFVMRKLFAILFFGHLEHLPKKITCRIHFWMQFLQFFKKEVLCGLVFLLKQSHHLN